MAPNNRGGDDDDQLGGIQRQRDNVMASEQKSKQKIVRVSEKQENRPYEERLLPELKEECRKRMLPVSGKKEELVKRLEVDDLHDSEYWPERVLELKKICEERGLHVSGTKVEIVSRLTEYDKQNEKAFRNMKLQPEKSILREPTKELDLHVEEPRFRPRTGANTRNGKRGNRDFAFAPGTKTTANHIIMN